MDGIHDTRCFQSWLLVYNIYAKTSSAGLMVLVDKDMAQEYMINDEADDGDVDASLQ